jgi:hypothetical protein
MLHRLLSLVKRSAPDDPTRTWPQMAIAAPRVDSAQNAIGPLHFGEELAAARVLGRPASLRWTQPGYCELLYAPAGFQIDFDAGRLAYATFFIAADSGRPRGASIVFSTPVVDGTRLTGTLSMKRIEALFGMPAAKDVDEDETILNYLRGKLTIEFEGSAAGLKRVNVYPTSPLAEAGSEAAMRA